MPGPLDGVRVIETLNGGSRGNENERAADLAHERGFAEIGGSDAHIVSHIGRCATRFEGSIESVKDLVAALREGCMEPVRYEEGRWTSPQ